MDSIPFLHANRLFTIFFVEDLEFKEVRGILDHLLDRNAFPPEVSEQSGPYHVRLEQVSFTVWVSDMDVVIQKD